MKHNLKKISVLVSTGRHPLSGATRYCKNDGRSLSLGLMLAKEALATLNVLTASHSDDPLNPAFSDYLALGAKHIQVIKTNIDDDMTNPLVEALKLEQTDLILTGSRAENAEDTGLLPYLIAEKLGLPLIANALELSVVDEGLEVLQFLPKGKRRRVVISLPAVVVVHPLAQAELHYAHALKAKGHVSWLDLNIKSQKLTEKKSASTIIANFKESSTEASTAKMSPIKLKALEDEYVSKKTGHQRLMEAITTEAKGGAVVIEQTSGEKAQVILTYLREHHLIDF